MFAQAIIFKTLGVKFKVIFELACLSIRLVVRGWTCVPCCPPKISKINTRSRAAIWLKCWVAKGWVPVKVDWTKWWENFLESDDQFLKNEDRWEMSEWLNYQIQLDIYFAIVDVQTNEVTTRQVDVKTSSQIIKCLVHY